ncbi:tetratricopeptide repeat-containing sensor histidine kinase [Spirosoma fluviale]|uniref:Signal transduction histidine kinase n=1 Tax=Spirosoma fluviale TaxID=1597977 RepID=A0A286G295_9BACT|nr:ATP-binding protein [Spirosoma fluviale]SOD89598.1 Signal transduction histidine kinase [Spirosoma fluviale]
MKKLLLFLCLLAQTGFAQVLRIDSLKQALRNVQNQPKGYAKDTLAYTTLKAIAVSYVDVNLDSAVHYNRLMIKICEDSTRQKDLIYAYQLAGYLYQLKGNHYESIRFHYKALPLAEKLKKYAQVASSKSALAHAFTSLKQYGKAEELCGQGLAVLEKNPNPYIELSILNVLGIIYRNQRNLQKALSVNQVMHELAQKEGDPWYQSHGLQAIGLVYKEMGDMKNAISYHQKALEVCHKKDGVDFAGRIDLEENILVNMADLYIRMKNWQLALLYCRLAKETAIPAKNSSILLEADEKLYTIYKQMGKPDKALKAYESYVLLKDSLSKEKNQQRIESLQAQYDNVQKTNALQRQTVNLLAEKNRSQALAQSRNGLFIGIVAILLILALLVSTNRRLQTKNREIDRQRGLLEMARSQLANANKTLETRVEERTRELVLVNQELVKKNEEIKTALYKGQTIERKRVALELHDNLSSLLSAVNMSMQAINPQNLSASEQSVYQNVRHLIQNAYSEVRNISHNILPAELEREGLSITLTTLVERLNQSSPLLFTLAINGLQSRLPVEIEFNVYSIVLELINNAIKHAQATTVAINLFRTNLGIDISVTDDGVGFAGSHAKRGVGLQNIQTRLDSLGGTFSITLPVEKGTRVAIKIPIETNSFNGNLPKL